MPIDPRACILLGANALLLFLTLLVNSSLAQWSLYLLLLGPMVIFPPLYLRHSSFFICTLVSGLWVDAAFPIPFGLCTICFLFLGTLIYTARIRFRTEHNFHPILLTHLSNLFMIVVFTLITGKGLFGNSDFWKSVAVTTVLSHISLIVIAPWFFNLQRLFFELFRTDTEPEDLPIS